MSFAVPLNSVRRSLKRRQFGSLCIAVAILPLLLTGCGGGKKGSDSDTIAVDTNSNNAAGRVENAITPQSGSVFVPPSQSLGLVWLPELSPPTRYTVALKRYQEPTGGESLSVSTQKIDVSKSTDNQYGWTVRRRDNFDLDRGGVYYLELGADGGQLSRRAFIVSQNRSAGRGVSVGTGSEGGSLANVIIEPAPGSVYITRDTTFLVRWPDGAVPPARFGVFLRRYKEARGNDSGSDNEQEIQVERVGDTNAWRVRRRDNFALDSAGTYYMELQSGADLQRAAYIVDR